MDYPMKYLKWVKDTDQKNLTGNQAEFAMFLFEHADEISKVGRYTHIFRSIRGWILMNKK